MTTTARNLNRIYVSEPCISGRSKRFVDAVITGNQYSQAHMVGRFECELGNLLGGLHVIATSSGTAALHLALAAHNIGPGDEVIVPDLTFVATANAVLMCGATPVLCDVDSSYWGANPHNIASRITRRTKAAIPVHLYGSITSGAYFKRDGIAVIEDAAEALGATADNDRAGTIGDCGCFSFYGNKIITTGGEGGAVVTRNPYLAHRLRYLRGQAMDPNRRYYHTELGFNYRMTELQAAIGLGQLQDFHSLLARRRAIINAYASRLSTYIRTFRSEIVACPCRFPESSPWLFTFLVPEGCNRDVLKHVLASYGIETRPVFIPLHRLPHLRDDESKYPISSLIANNGISLPTHPNLTEDQVDHICNIVLAELDRQLNTHARTETAQHAT